MATSSATVPSSSSASKYAVPDGGSSGGGGGGGGGGAGDSARRADAAEYLYVDMYRFRFAVRNSANSAAKKPKKPQQPQHGLGDPRSPAARRAACVPATAGERARAKALARRLNHEFVYGRRTSSRPAIVITLVVLTLTCAYQTVFYHTEVRDGDGSRPADGNYGLDMAGRIASIVSALVLAAIAATEKWAQNALCAQLSFLFCVLLLSLSWAFAQLLQAEPDYGALICVQAFIFTFLPLHPFEQLSIAATTWLVYGVPSWSSMLTTMNDTYPFILIGVGMLEAIAHSRRYGSMMQGFLDRRRVDTQRAIMANESVKCDGLLRSMLPRSIIVKLELGEAITPERFDCVTVIFAEICHFGQISQRASAHELVNLLNDVFSTFDGLIDRRNVHKVETVCQVYMAVAGCPKRTDTHAEDAGNLALDLIHCIEYLSGSLDMGAEGYSTDQGTRNPRGIPEAVFSEFPERRKRINEFFAIVNSDREHAERLQIHVGINSGPIRAGVVGINNPRFKLFGDTVNTASRMESTCEAGRIQASPSCVELLRQSSTCTFDLEERGKIQVKGKGQMLTHYVRGCKARQEIPTISSLQAQPSGGERKEAGEVSSSSSSSSASAAAAAVKAENDKVHHAALKLRHSDEHSAADESVRDIEARGYADSAGVNGLVGLARRQAASHPEKQSNSVRCCAMCGLWWRTKALAVIDRHVDVDTLIVLDRDIHKYRKLKMPGRVRQLQLMVLVFLFVLSCGMSLSDYWVVSASGGVIDPERQLMGMLRNSVAVPVLLMLLVACRAERWFALYGEYLTLVVISISGGFIIYSVFMVYLGDPGFMIAFLIIILDVDVLRLTLRVVLTVLLLVLYSTLILTTRDQFVLSTLGTATVPFVLFLVAVHGVEHFNHLSDFEKRGLQAQTEQLKNLREHKWELLTDLLPKPIARRILGNAGGDNSSMLQSNMIADVYDGVTVIFTDMKGFTAYSSKLDPSALQHFLNGMFSAFDEILSRWGLHKIEVIGDAYFVVSGAPNTAQNDRRSPEERAGFATEGALQMVRAVSEVCDDPAVRIRVGLHSGSVIGGVVGQRDPRFHLFGHTVELANRMEEYGEPDRVHISADTYVLLERLEKSHAAKNPGQKPLFEFEDRGNIEIPSEDGPVHAYFVEKSRFGREHRSMERREKKEARGNEFLTANSSLKFLSQSAPGRLPESRRKFGKRSVTEHSTADASLPGPGPPRTMTIL